MVTFDDSAQVAAATAAPATACACAMGAAREIPAANSTATPHLRTAVIFTTRLLQDLADRILIPFLAFPYRPP
jgi:hypothetical protein